MLLWEIIIIIAIGIAAAAATIFLIIRDIKGKGTCSSGTCSACNPSGQCKSSKKSESNKTPVGKN